MRLNLTVRHGQVNPGVRSYVESKFAKLGRRLFLLLGFANQRVA